jgi:fluoride exporter
MSASLLTLVLVALGGAIGGVGRFWISGLVARRFGETFPLGTMTVNVSGAASIGVLAGLLLTRDQFVPTHFPIWAALVIGILGSYTTVSSFSLQTLALLRAGEMPRAAMNVLGSLFLCLSAAAAGFTIVTHWIGS